MTHPLIRPADTVTACDLCRADTVLHVGTRAACVKCGTMPYREELTPAGPQFVIPGCERVAPDNGKPYQMGLF